MEYYLNLLKTTESAAGYENTNLDEEELYWPFLYALESRFTRSAIRFFSDPDLTVQNGCALVIFLQHGLADCQMRVDSRFQDTTSIFAVRIFLTKCAWNQGQKKAKIVCAIDLPWTCDTDRARYKMYKMYYTHRNKLNVKTIHTWISFGLFLASSKRAD